MDTVYELLNRLWKDYTELNPQARAIYDLLERRDKKVVNDHIALRTYRHATMGIDVLAAAFIRGGYVLHGEYEFPEKKLFARHFEHDDEALPKVFISELKLEEFSPALRQSVEHLINQMPQDLPKRWDLPVSGRPWAVSYGTYEMLRAESEYAAWMAAFGFRANHFTVLVNVLNQFDSLQALNAFIKHAGFRLNESGGEIKGSPQELLEQSSTLADEVDVEFTDGMRRIPACYYEFARRYSLPSGKLFQSFVAKSADKIFESTDRR